MAEVNITARVDLNALAYELANSTHSHIVLTFITLVDEYMCDPQWSKLLRDRLDEVIGEGE